MGERALIRQFLFSTLFSSSEEPLQAVSLLALRWCECSAFGAGFCFALGH